MKLRNLRYFIKEAFKSLVKNRLMTVASILTVASCMLILTVSYCLAMNINHLMSQFQDTMGLSVFLCEDLSADEINNLYNKVLNMEHVRRVNYIDKDEALRNFLATLELDEEDDLFDALLIDNPLRHSFEIELHSNRFQSQIINALEAMEDEGVVNIRHEEQFVALLISINNAVSIVGTAFTLSLGLISIVLIMNTIKLTVNSRRFEIGIMKYVGATDGFIRWPFIIEGILIGMIGSSIPVSLCWYGYDRAIDWIYSFPLLESIGDFLSVASLFSNLAPAAVMVGMLMGSLGSVISMRKYLQV